MFEVQPRLRRIHWEIRAQGLEERHLLSRRTSTRLKLRQKILSNLIVLRLWKKLSTIIKEKRSFSHSTHVQHRRHTSELVSSSHLAVSPFIPSAMRETQRNQKTKERIASIGGDDRCELSREDSALSASQQQVLEAFVAGEVRCERSRETLLRRSSNASV